MGFFTRKQAIETDTELERAMADAVPGADEATVRILASVAGLIAAVAYADREIQPAEQEHLKNELERIAGFSPSHVDSVAQFLGSRALRLNTTLVPRFTRVLREQVDLETRVEILDACLSMAAADGVISHDEVMQVRNLCTALGLSQAHYNALQSKYKSLLST